MAATTKQPISPGLGFLADWLRDTADMIDQGNMTLSTLQDELCECVDQMPQRFDLIEYKE